MPHHIRHCYKLQRKQAVGNVDALCSNTATGAAEPAVSLNGSPAKAAFPTHIRARSCTSYHPSSTSGPVQTQQPCSLKGSLSSDNIYAGLDGDSTGTYVQPEQGERITSCMHTAEHLFLTVVPLILIIKHSDFSREQLFLCFFNKVGYFGGFFSYPGVFFPF